MNNSEAGIKGQAKRYQRMLSGWARAVVEEALPHKQDFTGMQVAQVSSFYPQCRQPVGLEGSGSKPGEPAACTACSAASEHPSTAPGTRCLLCLISTGSFQDTKTYASYLHGISRCVVHRHRGTQLTRLRWQWAKFGVWRGAVYCSISTRSCTPSFPGASPCVFSLVFLSLILL